MPVDCSHSSRLIFRRSCPKTLWGRRSKPHLFRHCSQQGSCIRYRHRHCHRHRHRTRNGTAIAIVIVIAIAAGRTPARTKTVPSRRRRVTISAFAIRPLTADQSLARRQPPLLFGTTYGRSCDGTAHGPPHGQEHTFAMTAVQSSPDAKSAMEDIHGVDVSWLHHSTRGRPAYVWWCSTLPGLRHA